MRVPRRELLAAAASLGAVGLAVGLPHGAAKEPGAGSSEKDAKGKAAGGEEEVSPAEDLMREHGVLRRILLEKKEQQLFGADGFEKMVDRVASVEKSLGIYDLAQFTPRS